MKANVDGSNQRNWLTLTREVRLTVYLITVLLATISSILSLIDAEQSDTAPVRMGSSINSTTNNNNNNNKE